MAKGHGGRRPGAGRKPKAEKYAGRISKAEKRIADRLPEIAERLIDLALGLREKDAEGETFYTRPPDRQAIAICFDRIAGKADVTPELPASVDPKGDDFTIDLGPTCENDPDQGGHGPAA